MHLSIRSLMRIRSITVFMQVTSSIDVNHFSGNEIALDQKRYSLGYVSRISMHLKRRRVREAFNVTLILAWRRQDQTWRDGIDRNVRRKVQSHHPGHRCQQ